MPKPQLNAAGEQNGGYLSKNATGKQNFAGGIGFLSKYKNNVNNSKPPPQNATGAAGGALMTDVSDNPYTCCFVIPTGLEQCPALHLDDICDTCCTPEKPICSQDPNCHTLRECHASTLGETCKYLRGRGPRIPSWLAHCGRVLSFYGYFQEPVPESEKENYRIRQVQIRYYMDDGTIDVYEPKTFDPGFKQGRLIRRHKIPLPAPADSAFYTMEHLNVGCEVEFYGKTFLICGCNDPTRRYLNKMGISVPQNMIMPLDPYTEWRKDRVTSLFARKARIDLTQGKFKQFLLKNGKVLRFWAFWDDRCQDGGYLRQFIIHYFLEDDTIEIKEIPFNTPYSVFPTFLNRGKLLKDHKNLVPIPGIKEEALLVLNTTGGHQSVFMGQTFLEDRLCPGIDEKEYIKDRDLAIGAVLNVYGRAFIITDCDAFTRQYYREKYGIQNFTPLTLTDEELPKPLPRMETPPHIGIGDEADTLKNWDKIEIHPPHKDELKLLIMDKDMLGFTAQFYKPQHKVNCDRRFIINYFMADDTVKVYEKWHPNTGMKPGTFMKRCRPRRAETGLIPRYDIGEVNEYYEPSDFYVGNTLFLNGFQFLITSADSPTLSYMEQHKHFFPKSNLCLVLEKVREAFGPHDAGQILNTFSRKDEKLNGIIEVTDFRNFLLCLVNNSLSEHEVITLTRAFKVQADAPGPDMSTLKSVIQTELNKHGYDRYNIQRIEYTLRYHDPCRFGLVDRKTLRSALLAARLPIDKYLLDFLVDKFEAADDCDRVNYCKVIEFLDWVKNPSPKANPSSLKCIMKWLEPKPPNKISCINYREFLEAVCPNYKCSLPEKCCPEEECCPEECKDQEKFCCPKECMDECEKYAYDRCLAGRVITDNNPWNEKDRCDAQDHCEFQMAYDPHSCKEFLGPVPEYMDSRVADAYACPPENDCIAPESDRRELLRCGDHIGFEDMYDRPLNKADKHCIWEPLPPQLQVLCPPCNP